ncbi:unnamed protein product, partial [Rotaria sp. Silwood2]
ILNSRSLDKTDLLKSLSSLGTFLYRIAGITNIHDSSILISHGIIDQMEKKKTFIN